MKQKYSNGTLVKVISPRHGTIIGVVKSAELNVVTGSIEYTIDYEHNGEIWTMIGVPAKAVYEYPTHLTYEVHTYEPITKSWVKEREFLFESQARKFIDDRRFPADKLKHIRCGKVVCEETYNNGTKQSTYINFD